MSTPRVPLVIERALDPVLNLDNVRKYTVYDGGAEVSYIQYNCQAPTNNSSEFTCNPPDRTSVIDPRVYINMGFSLVLGGVQPPQANGGTAPVGPGIQVMPGMSLVNVGLTDAPRAFPIAQIMQTLQCTINGNSLTTNLNTYFNAFIRMNTFKNILDFDYSLTPSMLDQFQEYSMGTGGDRNPLGGFSSNTSQCPRGAWGESINGSATNAFPPSQGSGIAPQVNVYVWSIINGVATPMPWPYINLTAAAQQHIALITFTVTEPLFLSPFLQCKSGFTNINTMKIIATYGNLPRIWSHDNVNGTNIPDANGYNVQVRTSQLLFRYVKPKVYTAIPAVIPYMYNEVAQLNSQTFTVAALGQQTFPLPATNLAATPWRLVVFAGDALADVQSSPSKSDTFMRIDSITVNWGQNQGKLANCTSYDLYQISQRNGLALSYTEWSKTVGSVLLIDIGKDIGLANSEAPGSIESPQLSMTVSVTNINSTRAIQNATLYCFVVYEGTVTISSQQMSKNIANLTREDVLLSTDSTKVSQVVARPPQMWMGGGIGSGVFGDIWNGIKSAASNVWSDARPALRRVINGFGRRFGGGMMMGGGDCDPEEDADCTQPMKRVRQQEGKSDEPMDSGMDSFQQDDSDSGSYGGGQLISRAQLQRNLRQDDGQQQ